MRGRMRRLMYSYHEGYTTEYEEYIVEDGEIVVNMGAYLSLIHICWEMTPTSIGGEKQAGISGGSQSPS